MTVDMFCRVSPQNIPKFAEHLKAMLFRVAQAISRGLVVGLIRQTALHCHCTGWWYMLVTGT